MKKSVKKRVHHYKKDSWDIPGGQLRKHEREWRRENE